MSASIPIQHSQSYRIRRFLNWFPLGLTYAFLYMGRYNLTVSKNALGDLMTKEDFGIIFAAGTITYAFSFLINGPLTDRIGGKKAILIGALGSALMNIIMGLTVRSMLLAGGELNIRLVFSVLYAANMYFQSYGAVAIVKVNASWFHVRERGIFGGIFGILISLGIYFAFDWGYAIVQATKATVETPLNFIQNALRSLLGIEGVGIDATWWVFFIPAGLLIIMFIIELFLLRDLPGQAGHQDFDTGDASSGEEDAPFQLGLLLKKILTNKIILTVAAIEFCSGVMRNGIMHWYPIYIKEELLYGADHFMRANWGLVLMLAGVTGGIFAGFVSDKVFGSRRGPVATLLYGLMLGGAVALIFSLDAPWYVLGFIVAFMSLSVIGVHGMLSGTATMDFGGRKGAATAVGLIDGFVYLGTGVQSLCLGFITTKSWSLWPPFLVPFALIGLILAIRIWHAFPQAKRKGK
ncbi:MFS transporter [candidate division LCP-89 bacterium B3_LCP]|uniref:MFS transporter n=1 Tax=candidate division LCP-89 bacterium B3_LCP TaxID=2012998 RepID=A0A532V5T5_UNCL8|nr:MAG: MFS transporter [candidate division LCP-89 bacterium B3_LCP]